MKLALILSGGGSNGIVQVGYCKYFAERGIQFDVITGTSTGALQGVMYAQEQYDLLEKLWREIKNHKDIYRHHCPFSFAQGFFKKGLYSAKPLREKIARYVDAGKLITSKQKFTSCSTNMTLARKHYVHSTPENYDIIKDFVYASASFPMAFEPLKYDGQYFSDGGLMEPIPVREAVKQLPEADKYIIALTNPVYSQYEKAIGKTIVGFAARAMAAMFDEIWINDMSRGLKNHWRNNKFVLLSPPKPPFESSLEWYPELYDEKIQEGYDIAKAACEQAGI